mgnify:CR=1 FL=1
MKKLLLLSLLGWMVIGVLAGCNRQESGMVYNTQEIGSRQDWQLVLSDERLKDVEQLEWSEAGIAIRRYGDGNPWYLYDEDAKLLVEKQVLESHSLKWETITTQTVFSPTGEYGIYVQKVFTHATPTPSLEGLSLAGYEFSLDVFVIKQGQLEGNKIGQVEGSIEGIFWTSDGKKAILAMDNQLPGRVKAWLVKIDEGLLIPLVEGLAFFVAFSPNGEAALYYNEDGLLIQDLQTNVKRVISVGRLGAGALMGWMETGSFVWFVNCESKCQLMQYDVEGYAARVLADVELCKGWAVPSPNGSRVACVDKDNGALYMLELDREQK